VRRGRRAVPRLSHHMARSVRPEIIHRGEIDRARHGRSARARQLATAHDLGASLRSRCRPVAAPGGWPATVLPAAPQPRPAATWPSPALSMPSGARRPGHRRPAVGPPVRWPSARATARSQTADADSGHGLAGVVHRR
jgi:hypothetical protein